MQQVPQQATSRRISSIEAHVSDVVDSVTFHFSDGTATMFGRKGGQIHRHTAYLAPGEVITRIQHCTCNASGALGSSIALTTSYQRSIKFTGMALLASVVPGKVSSVLRQGLSSLPPLAGSSPDGLDGYSPSSTPDAADTIVHAPVGHCIVGITPIKGSIAVVWIAPTGAPCPSSAAVAAVWTEAQAGRAFASNTHPDCHVHAITTVNGTPPITSGTPPEWRVRCFAMPAEADQLAAAWYDAKCTLASSSTVAMHIDCSRWTLLHCRVTNTLGTREAAEARRSAVLQAQGAGMLQTHPPQETTFQRLKSALLFLSMLGGTRLEVLLVVLLAALSVVAASISSSSRLIVGQVIGLVTSASDDEMQKSISEDWAARLVCWTPVDCDRRGGLQAALLGSYFLLRLLGGALSLLRQRVSAEAKRSRAQRLDSWLLHHLLHLPVQHFTTPDGADFAGRLSSSAVVTATWSLPQLGFTLCRAAVVMWFLVAASPWMALTALLGVLCAKFVSVLMQRPHAAVVGVLVAQRLQYSSVFLDLMRNMRLVTGLGAANRCAHRADSLAQSVDSVQQRELVLDTAASSTQLAMRHVVTCVALLVGVWWPAADASSDSSATAASIAASFLLLEDFMGLATGVHEELLALKVALPTLERFKAVATVSFGTEVHSLQGGVEIVSGGGVAADGPRMFADDSDCSSDDDEPSPGCSSRGSAPTLQLSDVCAVHPSAPWRPAVAACSLLAAPAAPAALLCTGSSGDCLLDVITSQCDLLSGHVELGGVPLAQWSEPALHRTVVMVRAMALLLNGSVLHNVLLGCASEQHGALARALAQGALTGAAPSPLKAAPASDLHSPQLASQRLIETSAVMQAFLRWVNGLPGGLHTQVGQGGVSLGVGERQLLSLARSLLQRPRVLALDLTACALGEDGLASLKSDLTDGPLARCTVLVLVSSAHTAASLGLATLTLRNT